MNYSVIIISLTQVIGDIICLISSIGYFFRKNNRFKIFFLLNAVSFLSAAFCDSYYDYYFRITKIGIEHSVGLAITLPVFIFQICQAYNWFSLIRLRSVLFSSYNFPYVIFAALVSAILIYYFSTENSLSVTTVWYQSISVALDMLIWIFSIICLSRASSYSIVLLALGCLMIVSADLTTRCLFMFEMTELASAGWIHGVWTAGVLVMASGFIILRKNINFEFCHPSSLQVVFSAWISSASLVVFMIGFFFLSYLKLNNAPHDMHSTLWSFPVALMFIMIFSVLMGNRISKLILLPIENFLLKINLFNAGQDAKGKLSFLDDVYEFKQLGSFIEQSFSRLSLKLNHEVKIAMQVAHDIRSPLSSLEILIKRLPELEESKYILLRDAISHIRDVTNSLEKNDSSANGKNKFSPLQLAPFLEYVISERRMAFSDKMILVDCDFLPQNYACFVDVVPSELKRIIVNIINNACEAMLELKNARVDISIENKLNAVIIVISDNGVGISPEQISSVFKHGFTTKDKGKGLGLSHAKENIEGWGGSISLMPNFDKGVSVYITLPIKKPPLWFVDKLLFSRSNSIICVDDSISIYHAWNQRLHPYFDESNLIYCQTKEELMSELTKHKIDHCIFLVDHEFSGKKYNGIDLIKIILLRGVLPCRIFFVTSRSTEPEIQEFCEKSDIKIISKNFVFKIPLQVS